MKTSPLDEAVKELRKIKEKAFKEFLEARRDFNNGEPERLKAYNLKYGGKNNGIYTGTLP